MPIENDDQRAKIEEAYQRTRANERESEKRHKQETIDKALEDAYFRYRLKQIETTGKDPGSNVQTE